MGALDVPPRHGTKVYLVYGNSGGLVPVQKWWGANELCTWNIGTESTNYPNDFIFDNYWFAYAYSLKRKQTKVPA